MSLRLVLQTRPSVPLEVEGLTPDAVRNFSLAEIEKCEVFEGNRRACLADFFTVSGNPGDEVHHWEGDLAGVHWIGAGMKSGRIEIHGNAGRHLGSQMQGGQIQIHGDAGDWLGAEMHGGLIHVRGNTADTVGAAYRGSTRGMTQGTILVNGSAGHEIGSSMRRGLIAIGGNVGDLTGFGMLAGTILIFGDSGVRPGAGMKRGTLAFLGRPPALLPSFRRACRYQPENLALLFRHLQRLEFSASPQLGQEPASGGHQPSETLGADFLSQPFDLYNGDFLTGGRGEILLRA